MDNLPKRKSIRLSGYDYSQNGAYFITVCTDNKLHIFGEIQAEGASPFPTNVMRLSEYGKVAEEQLLLIEDRYKTIHLDKYVIMPNHIHMILLIQNDNNNATTISNVMCSFKSLTTRSCKAIGYSQEKVFQRSFYDHIIRDNEDYLTKWRYIDENLLKWQEDDLFS